MKTKICIALFISFLTACSSIPTRRGIVAMKIKDGEAHVAIPGRYVNVGDHVAIYSNECKRPPAPYPQCKMVRVGGAVVTQILNKDYSVVRVDPGVDYDEGMTVQVQ